MASSHLAIPISANNRTASGGFETSEGTLYVSKPYRSKTSKKLRALITFAPRKSTFDISNESSGTNEFRGFFSLFWISIFIFTVQTYVRSIETSGRPLNLHFATMFSQDAITLAISDATLVLSTGVCVPFAMAIKKGWIKYYYTGIILQHLIQTSILFTAITWTFNRKWPWVQSGFFTLHSLVMIMKMHSYMTVNGHLQDLNYHRKALLKRLREAVVSVGGWDKAVTDAQEHQAELDATNGSGSLSATESTGQSTPSGTPAIPAGASTSYVDPTTATALRKRLVAVASQPNGGGYDIKVSHKLSSKDGSEPQSFTYLEQDSAREPHPLINHPDSSISAMAEDLTELDSEMTSLGPSRVKWPDNISWKNFAVYQLIPTLVYELEYPRTDRIRPIYVFEKTVATFGTFALLYTVTESFILPYTPSFNQSIFRSLLDLALPFMIAYLLLFFIIFVLPIGSSMKTGWNSTSWDEFSRKWNKPVHAFLLRHVYAPTLTNYKMSRTWAMVVTFLLSACVHELVMVIVTQKFRFYLFTLQIIQIPMILISRIPVVKRNKMLGNVVFWLGLYTGFPLLCVAYVAY